MYRLYLDTSSSMLTVVLTKNGEILKSYSQLAIKKQTDLAIITIKNLLQQVNLTLKQINELVVTNGPGSYTGIRVAITFAKTLKVLNKSLVIFRVNSLLLQAGLKTAISIITGYNNKSYLAVYEQTREIIPMQIVTKNAKQGIIDDLPNYAIIEDFKDVNIVNNFIELNQYLIKIENIVDLKPIYLGSNF